MGWIAAMRYLPRMKSRFFRIGIWTCMLFLCIFCVPFVGIEGHAGDVALSGLGTREMVLDAGAKRIKSPPRRNVVTINAPGELNQADTEYILTTDIIADGTAFIITADRVTLNLNGHTVIYNNKELKGGPKSVYGISLPKYGQSGIAIVNGVIKQGEGNGGGNNIGWGHNPIFAEGVRNLELFGITAEYRGKDIVGFFIHWGKNVHIHHNTIEDKGVHITNRHQGLDAIRLVGADAKIHHNLLKRCRHRAFNIASGTEVYNNEIYLDSQATNSYGVMCYRIRNFSIHHNKIYGRGEHPVGVGAVSGSSNGKIYSNYIEVQNTQRSSEYGNAGSACIRMTWGTDKIEVHHNTLIVHAQNDYAPGVDSWGRAIWAGLPKADQSVVFHDNVIIANNIDGKAKAAAIAIVCNNKSPNLIFKNNKVISNWSNVLLADSYGYASGYARFIENTFVRQDNYSSYRTIRSQYPSKPSTAVFINNKFESGASIEDIELEFRGAGKKEIGVGWYLDVVVTDNSGKPVSDVDVLLKDIFGLTVFEGVTGGKGSIRAEVVEYFITNAGPGGTVNTLINKYIMEKGEKIIKTPHTLKLSKNGQSVKRTINMDGNKTLQISF